MLVRLLVKNFGIIEEIDWSPGAGLNILIGETGAGKSLVVDAISALLSGKLEESTLRYGADETRIEGVFDLSKCPGLIELLDAQGIETDDVNLILSLTQKRGGRTIIRVNGSAVPRSLATSLGRMLVDIHGQSQHLSLLDPSSHLDFLDNYAGTIGLRHEFGKLAHTISQLIREIADVFAQETDFVRRRDFLNFQYQEINRATLADGEDVALEDERKVLMSAEKLKQLAIDAEEALDGDNVESPATSRLYQAVASLEKLSAIDDRLKIQTDLIRDALFGIGEASRDIRNYAARINSDPKRLEEVENRIELIRGLKRKYGKSISEIVAFAEKTRQSLDEFDSLDDRKNILSREIEINKNKLLGMAKILTGKRRISASTLDQAVNTQLKELGMERAQFSVSISKKESNDGYDLTGADKIEFLVSTNPGEPFQPIEKIASTGELSRFTLAAKTVLASADKVPLLIFDEIDIGVGGRSGDVIGRKLSEVAKSHQVICITHLPQIACYGAHHFSIRKILEGERAKSVMTELSGDDLITELASMLSSKESRNANEIARELIANASLNTTTFEEPN